VLTADDARRALDFAEAFSPEIAFVDLRMPRIDGFEVARELRSEYPEAVIVGMSGFARAEKEPRFEEAGFDHYMAKPLNFKRLYRLLERA
jgi:DNA-binding response OmpR family regulator